MPLLRKLLTIALLTLALAGCANNWRKPGAGLDQFNRDLAQCDIMAAPDANIPPPVRFDVGLRQQLTDAEKYCLRGLGWMQK